MSVLFRYVLKEVLTYVALVMALLMVLTGLYLFLTQMNELGIGRYGVFEALVVVACRLPQQAFTVLPIAALMGALLALGNLARGGELVVMRVSGASVFRLASWVACAGTLLAVLTWCIGDYLAPPADQFANRYKSVAQTNQLGGGADGLMWAKDGNMFMSVYRQQDFNNLNGLYVVRFDDQRQLHSVGRAVAARLDDRQGWQLQNYDETRFESDRVVATHTPVVALKTNLSAEFMSGARAEPSSLAGHTLLKYARYLEANHLKSDEYLTAFWIRVARTCSIVVIMMLALPFSFGSMRSTGMGTRIVIGISVGAIFFLLAKLFVNARFAYALDPLVIAWGPTMILTVVTALALLRVR